MWVEFVVGSRPCSERFFSGYSGFPLPSKTNKKQFNLDYCQALYFFYTYIFCPFYFNFNEELVKHFIMSLFLPDRTLNVFYKDYCKMISRY